MTKEQIISQTNTILSNHFEIEISSITPDATIWNTLDLDSLRAMELMIIAKKQFNIEIPSRALSHIITFDDLYEYILTHQIKLNE
jgi:acyl carrier protein